MTYAKDTVLTVNGVILCDDENLYTTSNSFSDIKKHLIDNFHETVEKIIPSEHQDFITKLGYFPIRIEALSKDIIGLQPAKEPYVVMQAQNTLESVVWAVDCVLDFFSNEVLPYKTTRVNTCWQKITGFDFGVSSTYTGSTDEDDFYAFKETVWENNPELPGIQVTFIDENRTFRSVEQTAFHNTGMSNIHSNGLLPIYSNGNMLE